MISILNSKILFVLFVLCCCSVHSIRCLIAYGQRGRLYENGISWTRECPATKYCFETVTNNIEKMKTLFDYPWDPYYDQYYVRSCGGDLGTLEDYHPFRPYKKTPMDSYLRAHPMSIKVNITTPAIITGQGGTVEMNLHYVCRRDLCSGATARAIFSVASVLIPIIIAAFLMMF